MSVNQYVAIFEKAKMPKDQVRRHLRTCIGACLTMNLVANGHYPTIVEGWVIFARKRKVFE